MPTATKTPSTLTVITSCSTLPGVPVNSNRAAWSNGTYGAAAAAGDTPAGRRGLRERGTGRASTNLGRAGHTRRPYCTSRVM